MTMKCSKNLGEGWINSDKLNVLNRVRKYKDDPKKMKKIIREMQKSIKRKKQIK